MGRYALLHVGPPWGILWECWFHRERLTPAMDELVLEFFCFVFSEWCSFFRNVNDHDEILRKDDCLLDLGKVC